MHLITEIKEKDTFLMIQTRNESNVFVTAIVLE
jgi:hypothetical protein